MMCRGGRASLVAVGEGGYSPEKEGSKNGGR